MLSRVRGTTGLALLILMSIGALSLRASASQYFAQTSIQVSTAEVDVDLRVDWNSVYGPGKIADFCL